jgi:DNA polymerase-3 subunit delta
MNRLVEAEIQCKTTGLPADAISGQTLLGIALSARNRSRAGGARA